MSVDRIIGTETEYGIYRPGDPWANAVVMSAEAVHELGLEPGSLAVAVVKATTVIVESPKD